MSYRSLVTPNLGFRVLAGNCLAMAQGIVGARVMHNSATDAANATTRRHHDRTIPAAVCVLWFDHWGSYGMPGREVYANWGHVVVYVPGLGFASSSPVAGDVSTPYFYNSIGAVERAFNCTFRFWTEDINGTLVCEQAQTAGAVVPEPVAPQRKKMHNMFMVRYKNGNPKGGTGWLVVGAPKPEILVTVEAARGILDQWGAENSYETDKGGWLKFLRMSGMSAEDISALNVK